jgi:ketosteroid isomerase-like protein
MKHIIGKTCLLLAGLVFSSLVWAGQDGRNDDHEKLRALQAKVGDAFNKRDFQTLASCFTRDFAITTIDQTTLSSASEIEKYFNKVFKSPDSIVTDLKISPTPDIQAKFVDADNGFCYGKDHGIFSLQNGRKVPIDSRWTAMLHRENGEWKIAALHGGVNFINNPVLARGETTAKLALLIGFAAGLVLTIVGYGIFLTRKTTKN